MANNFRQSSIKDTVKNIKEFFPVIVTVTTACSYLYVYSFESSQCSYYRIPKSFIEFDISSMLYYAFISVLIGSLLILTFPLFDFVISFARMIKSRISPISYSILIWVTSFVEVVILMVAMFADVGFKNGLILFTVMIVSSIPVLLIEFVSPVETSPTPAFNFKLSLINTVLLIAFGLFMTIVITVGVGALTAKNNKVFNVIKIKGTSFGIVKYYGSKLICKSFNPKTHLFTDSIMIVNLAQNMSVEISATQDTIRKPVVPSPIQITPKSKLH